MRPPTMAENRRVASPDGHARCCASAENKKPAAKCGRNGLGLGALRQALAGLVLTAVLRLFRYAVRRFRFSTLLCCLPISLFTM
jgi:hypothetical protein